MSASLKKRREPLFLIAATATAWIIVLTLFFQVLAATLAWAANRLGWGSLTLSPGMLTTGKAFAAVLAWAAAFTSFLLLWLKYNRHRYFDQNRRQVADFSARAPVLSWSEAYLDFQQTEAPAASEPLPYQIKYNAHALNLPGLINGSPKEMLSFAAVLNRKCHFEQAAGLARLILAHPGATPLQKLAALRELQQALAGMGPLANLVRQRLSSVSGGHIHEAKHSVQPGSSKI